MQTYNVENPFLEFMSRYFYKDMLFGSMVVKK